MAYINDRNPKRLSPSVSARCEIGLDKLTPLENNPLSPNSEYYDLSQHLYKNITYRIRSERKDGDRTIVTVEQSIPRPLIDADFFKQEKEGIVDDVYRKIYQRLQAQYHGQRLKNMEKEPNYFNWAVLKDGVAPELSPGQLILCNKKQ